MYWVGVAVLLRRYWWGMLWALSPDIMDWLILKPLTGEHPIHDLFEKVSTPWGFAVEMLLVVVVVLVLYLKGWKRPTVQTGSRDVQTRVHLIRADLLPARR